MRVTPTAQATIAARATVQANEGDADTLDNGPSRRDCTAASPAITGCGKYYGGNRILTINVGCVR